MMNEYSKRLKEMILEDMGTKEIKIHASEESKASADALNETKDKTGTEELIKRVNEKIKKLNENTEENIVFDYFHGGLGAFSEHLYIIKENDNYLFKYGNDSRGRIIKPNNMFLRTIVKSKEEYEVFINKLNEYTKNWKEKYDNKNIIDGTQWHLKFENTKFYGSNEYPDNYNETKGFLLDTFGGRYNIPELSIELLENVRRITGMDIISIISNQKVIPDLEAIYMWSGIPGGVAIIVKSNGEYLLGNKAINPNDMIKEFKAGTRTGNLNN